MAMNKNGRGAGGGSKEGCCCCCGCKQVVKKVVHDVVVIAIAVGICMAVCCKCGGKGKKWGYGGKQIERTGDLGGKPFIKK